MPYNCSGQSRWRENCLRNGAKTSVWQSSGCTAPSVCWNGRNANYGRSMLRPYFLKSARYCPYPSASRLSTAMNRSDAELMQ